MFTSTFDNNLKKETDSLELEKRLLTSTNIQFDYYSINCREIQKTPNAIHSIYRGNVNRPNIILNDNQYFPTYYQSSELAIYSKLHEGTHQAELVIKHTPISNSITPIYVCFFLYSSSNNPNESQTPEINGTLDGIIQNTDSFNNFGFQQELDISPLLEPYTITNNINKEENKILTTWKIYETINRIGKCMVVIIEKPIYIKNELFTQIPQNMIPPFEVKNLILNMNTNEGFISVSGISTSDTGYALSNNNNNVMVCDMIPDPEYGEVNVVQMPLLIPGSDATDSLHILQIIVIIGTAIAIFTVDFFAIPPIIIKLVREKLSEDFKVRNLKANIALYILPCIVLLVGVIILIIGARSKPLSSILIATSLIFIFSFVIIAIGLLMELKKEHTTAIPVS